MGLVQIYWNSRCLGLTPKEQRESERDIRNLCDAKIKSKDAATEEWKITYNESVAML